MKVMPSSDISQQVAGILPAISTLISMSTIGIVSQFPDQAPNSEAMALEHLWSYNHRSSTAKV